MIRHAAIAAALACATGAGAAAAAGDAATQEVRYGAYAIEVPASWPVYDLAEDPATCVRFDRHAVYLGRPGADQRCPAHAVGRSEAILVEPDPGPAAAEGDGRILRAPKGAASPTRLPRTGPDAELRVDVPSAGVVVSATWQRHPGMIRHIVDGARLASGAEPRASVDGRAEAQPSRAKATRRVFHKGLGFDACAAPSKSAMSAWSSSPYSAVGIYIGGANRGCSQPNLSSGWVRREIRKGWALMPIYVGLQAPGTSCNCATISRNSASSQGRSAARDAMSDAKSLGLGAGTPIYFDMEYYTRSASNSRTALRFMEGWTKRLHRGGYVSGVYSSASAGIRDLVSRYRSDYAKPDDIWIANWDGRRTTDDPYVPRGYWSDHQRIRQYRGSHNESYRGVTINIDNNYVDGAVAGLSDLDADGVADERDLCKEVRGPSDNSGCPYPSHVSGGLVRYLNTVDGDRREGDHLTTTGGVEPAYRFQENLGFLLRKGMPGTAPLYSCRAQRDQFLSHAADCGGAKVLDTIGYAYAQPPDGVPTNAIYRCRLATTDELSVSDDPNCDGADNVNEGRLGFTISIATLGRYRDSVKGHPRNGDHLTTTGAAGPAYRFQANLGFLLNQRLPGTVPVYSCDSGRDQFLSRAADCGGVQVLGVVGYAYSRRPAGMPTRAIYSCLRAKDDELTVSYDPQCNSAKNQNQGQLGFTISIASLGRYLDSVDGDRREGDHFTTTRGVRPAYRFQGNVGFVLNQRLPGTVGLYSCDARHDQYLSRASQCGGEKVLGRIGWAYANQPNGIPTKAIYRCNGRNGERFISTKAKCRRSSRGAGRRLGYVMATPLGGLTP